MEDNIEKACKPKEIANILIPDHQTLRYALV